MRKHLLWASATLALLTACGGGGSPAPASGSTGTTCVNQSAAHHAYVVVQHLSGKTVERCVGFGGTQLTGEELMDQSKIKYTAQTFSGLGKAVCAIDGEPAQFTECFPKDQTFWAMYVSTGGGPWQEAQAGYTATNLKDGDAIAWQYRPATGSPPPPPLPKK